MRRDIEKKHQPRLIILLLLPCFLVLNKNLQNDIWFLLNSGRYVFENGFPFVEPFTIHQGLDFVMQQWLSACIFWLTYDNFGEFGLHVLVLLFYLGSVYFLYKLCMIVSEGFFFVSFCVTLLSSIMLSTMIAARPMIFSTLVLVVELYLLENYRNSNNVRYLLPLPLLSLLIINLHAAVWPMAFIIMIPYLIELFRFTVGTYINPGYKKGAIIISIVMMFMAGFINPYGIDAIMYLFKSYGAHELSMVVEEMRRPTINTFSGLLTISYLFTIAFIYAIFRKQTTKPRYVLLTLGTAFLTLMAIRNLSLFAICGIFPTAYLLKDIHLPTSNQELANRSVHKLRKILIATISLSVIISLIILPQSNLEDTNKIIKKQETMLQNAIQFILYEEKQGETVLYTGYNDGGMAEFMGIPAYLDPRAEVFLKSNNNKEDILKEYCDLQSGRILYKDFLNKYEFTHLILTKNDILYTELKENPDYEISYINEIYTLYEKH